VNKINQSRDSLMKWIHMASFSAYDMALYLDTHPEDEAALEYYLNYVKMRKQAVRDFSQNFYPLTMDEAAGCTKSWEWGDAPLPWEGGC